ncbi:MAG: hypothetical protein KAQ68_08560 [Clostridiales bacterium]|nr:hypothetical protein [Clostridiales bacterium]
MKVIMKVVEMLAWFDTNGKPHPIRFRTQDNNGKNIIIKLDGILNSAIERHAGNQMVRFDCRVTIKNTQRELQLKYETTSCKWYLSKM